eukprot:5537682-Pleurochrysis_carterae.AAC.3
MKEAYEAFRERSHGSKSSSHARCDSWEESQEGSSETVSVFSVSGMTERCYQLSTRELTSERARVSPFGASTWNGGRPRAPRDGVRACVAAWASEGVVIRNEVK